MFYTDLMNEIEALKKERNTLLARMATLEDRLYRIAGIASGSTDRMMAMQQQAVAAQQGLLGQMGRYDQFCNLLLR
jgi:hypothetical protein